MPVIYSIENKVNGKKYIGCAMDFQKRVAAHKRHLKRGTHHNQPLLRAWRRYGASHFSFSVVETIDDPSEIVEREAELIAKHRTTDRAFGYNLCHKSWSRLGVNNTPEQNAKIGAGNRGKTRSPELRKLLSDRQKGKKRGPRDPVIVARVAAAQRGKERRPLSPQHRAKIGAAHIGRKWPDRGPLNEEHRRAISAGLTGKKRKPFTDEHRMALSRAAKRQAAEGRHLRGEQLKQSKIREADVIEIRRLAAAGVFHQEIAGMYGIGRKAVTKIVNRQRWAHVRAVDESAQEAKGEMP